MKLTARVATTAGTAAVIALVLGGSTFGPQLSVNSVSIDTTKADG